MTRAPYKPNDVSDTTFEPGAIAHGGILALTGRDALTFCQAQFMNDVAPLTDGQWQWSGWLSAKGRVQALFALIRIDSQTVWLWLPDNDPNQLAESLGRFVFRSKVEMHPVPAAAILDRQGLPATVGHASTAELGAGLAQLDLSAESGALWLRLDTNRAPTGPDPDAQSHWQLHAIRHGLPRILPDARDRYTPHMLSLERLAAFSVRKGCYPGQEIVSRTHFLGQSRRRLVRLDTDSSVEPGGEIRHNGQAQGNVLDCAPAGHGRFEAIAVLPSDVAVGHALECGDARLEVLPLLSGLRRLPGD